MTRRADSMVGLLTNQRARMGPVKPEDRKGRTILKDKVRVLYRDDSGSHKTYTDRETAYHLVGAGGAVWNSAQSAIMLVKTKEEIGAKTGALFSVSGFQISR